MNDICKDCLKWEKMKEKCSVYWEGKKWCTLKVRTMDEWHMEKRVLGVR